MGAAVRRPAVNAIADCGDFPPARARLPRFTRWFLVSVAAKLVRASEAPVVNQVAPRFQPATSGGSNSCWFMFTIGESALSIEKPFQPISFTERATNSAGQ